MTKIKTLRDYRNCYMVEDLVGLTKRQAECELSFWQFDTSNMPKLLRSGGLKVVGNRVQYI